MKDIAAPPVSPVVWEAALGRRVVLIEDRLWVSAREKARAMLGGEPVYVQTPPSAFLYPDEDFLLEPETNATMYAVRLDSGVIESWAAPFI